MKNKSLEKYYNTLAAIPVWLSNVNSQLDIILHNYKQIAFLKKDERRERLQKTIEIISSFKNPITDINKEYLLSLINVLLSYDSEETFLYEKTTSIYENDIQTIQILEEELLVAYKMFKNYEIAMHSLYLALRFKMV